MTTYEYIAQNKRRTWLLVLLFPLTFALLTYGVLWLFDYFLYGDANIVCNSMGQCAYSHQSDVNGVNSLFLWLTPILWGVAMLWAVGSYFFGDQIILHSAHAIEIYREDQPELFRLVENVAITRGLPTPRVYIMKDRGLNAFATGRDPQHASVALTLGLVETLDRAELEGVIAHEMAHVENRDIRLMLITVAGISFFTLLAELCFRAALAPRRSSGKDNDKGALILLAVGIIFMLYGYIIAPLIRLAVSRQREYLADSTAALTTRNPGALASALRKISGHSVTEELKDHASMAAMCIENPGVKQGVFAFLSNLTATHPPIEDRIRRLEAMDGRV